MSAIYQNFSVRECKNQLNQLELQYRSTPDNLILKLYRETLLKVPAKQGDKDTLVQNKTILCNNISCPNIGKKRANSHQPCRFNHAEGLLSVAQEIWDYRNKPDPQAEKSAASVIDS